MSLMKSRKDSVEFDTSVSKIDPANFTASQTNDASVIEPEF